LTHQFYCVLCLAEIEKDIGDLIENVPVLDDMFTITDKIGAGNYTPLYFLHYFALIILFLG